MTAATKDGGARTDWAKVIAPFGFAAIVLAFFLGIGGCFFLVHKGQAIAIEAQAKATKEPTQ